jgi:hypothetical protein
MKKSQSEKFELLKVIAQMTDYAEKLHEEEDFEGAEIIMNGIVDIIANELKNKNLVVGD